MGVSTKSGEGDGDPFGVVVVCKPKKQSNTKLQQKKTSNNKTALYTCPGPTGTTARAPTQALSHDVSMMKKGAARMSEGRHGEQNCISTPPSHNQPTPPNRTCKNKNTREPSVEENDTEEVVGAIQHQGYCSAGRQVPMQGLSDQECQTSVSPKGSALTCKSCSHRLRFFWKDVTRFRSLKILQILLSIYIAVMSFFDVGPVNGGGLRDKETGYFFDQESQHRTEQGLILVNGTERALVARSPFEVACLGLSRLSAWFMYPALVFVFISKFRGTSSILSKTPLAIYMYTDSHELHVYCGWTIVVCSTIHSAFHIYRWAVQGNLYLLLENVSGLSGMLIMTCCILICIPMTILREQLCFEVRKNLHYLFIVFAGALIFHAPKSAIPNGGFTVYVFGSLLIWYFMDTVYCFFFMTEKVDTTKFSVVPTGVRMTMNVSRRFQKMGSQGGICYVCLPWLDKNQWHAFSLFENPSNPAERQIFIQKTGDWTTKLHKYLQRETVRPAWIHGPFPSPYDNADAYDNQILVATGIGITPALSVIRAHKDTRRINLIWAVRDKHLLEFFLRHLYLDHRGWNLIFYTGEGQLQLPNVDILTHTNLCIIEGRPKLDELIPNIIYGVESGLGLPESYTPDTKAVVSELLMDRFSELRSSRELTRINDAAEDLACYASELGFQLNPSQSYNWFVSGNFPVGARRGSEAVMRQLGIGFRPWDRHGEAESYVKKLDRNLVLPTWGMLYCGGAKAVLAEMETISDEYRLRLHVESFDW